MIDLVLSISVREIKDRSETIMEEKCKDDHELNFVLKYLQDVQEVIKEKNQRFDDAEKKNRNLENVVQRLEKIRTSFKTGVKRLLKSKTEYSEVFKNLRTSIQNIQSRSNNKSQENLSYERKLLEELMDSNAKLNKGETKYLENINMTLLNKEKEFDFINKLKDDLENELKFEQGKYDAVLQKLETEELDTDKLIEELKSSYKAEREIINNLGKMLEELDVERITQTSIEKIKFVYNNLVQRLTEFENKVKKREDEVLKCKKLVEELRAESFKIFDEDEKLLENLDEELC